jgi:hypothetical protein
MFSLQQNWRRRGQNSFCLEVQGAKGERKGMGEGDGPNNVCTREKINNKK